jgi:ferredoxin-thioredoxin reductase catalytic subunit
MVSLVEQIGMNILMSFTNNRHLQVLKYLIRSLINNRKNNGDKWSPCWTSDVTYFVISEDDLLIFTN